MKCENCGDPLTSKEFQDKGYECYECNINKLVNDLSIHLREARITFEELFRKILSGVDN